ncbi:MAG: hypothetical protein ACOC2U_00820 [bacterium]
MSNLEQRINKYLNEQDDGALSSKEKKTVMTAVQDVIKDKAMDDIAKYVQKRVDMDDEMMDYIFSVYEEAVAELMDYLKRNL